MLEKLINSQRPKSSNVGKAKMISFRISKEISSIASALNSLLREKMFNFAF